MSAIIRLACEEDGRRLSEIYEPYVTDSAVSFEIEAPTAKEMSSRVAIVKRNHPWLVCTIDSEVAGYVYASPHKARQAYCWSVDVAVYTDAAYRRRGLGTALYTSLFECLRLQGAYNAYAGITVPNDASVGLHEALGFQPVGIYNNVGFKCGAWRDVGWWHLKLQEYSDNPVEPIDLEAACALPQWAAAIESGLAVLRI